MANEIELTKTFQEKIFERIRDQIGELMSDEDLGKLVASAMAKAFFEPKTVKDGWSTKTEESWFLNQIRNLMAERVTAEMEKWIRQHPTLVEQAIQDAVAKGIYGLVIQHFENIFSGPVQIFAEQLRQKGIL